MNELFNKEITKFIFVGGLGFAVNLILVNVLTDGFGIWYLLSFIISALITWTAMFIGNLFFTFKNEEPNNYFGKYFSFICGYSLIFLANVVIVFILTSGFGLHYLWSITVGTIVVTFLTFFYSKFFVYKTMSAEKRQKIYFILVFSLTAFIVGLFNISEHFFYAQFVHLNGQSYYPYSLVSNYDATNVIGPRIKEIFDGNIMPSDIDVYEYKNAPFFWPPIAPIFYLPFRLFTDSVSKTVIAADFVFPAIFFGLFYFLYFTVSKKKWLSLFFAVLTALYCYFSIQIPPSSIDSMKLVWNTIWPFTSNPQGFFITRKESFIPALIPFLLFIIFAFKAITHKDKRNAIFAGVLFALNAYSYPYHFIYLSAAVGIFFVLSLIGRQKNLLRVFGWFLLSAVLVLLPFIINQIDLRNLPQFTEILNRFGLEIGRNFRWEHWQRYVWLILLSGLIYVLERKNEIKKNISLFIISLLLAGIAVLNMQVVLGYSVQSDHWLNRDILWGINIGYFAILTWLTVNFHNRLKKIQPVIALIEVILLISIFSNGVRYQYLNAKENYQTRTIPVYFAKTFNWLESNTPKDSVVLTPSFVSNYFIPLYTHNRIFVPRALNSIAPEKEILERLFVTYKLYGIDGNYLKTILKESNLNSNNYDFYEQAGITYLFAFKYLSKDLNAYTGSKNENKIPDTELNKILKDFDKYSCQNCFKKYKADYLLIGPQEKKISKQNFIGRKEFSKVYDTDGVIIYKIENTAVSL